MILAALAVCLPDRASSQDADLGFVAGAAWAIPTGGALADAYDGGPLARVGLVLRGQSRFAGLLTAGFYRRTAHPDRPVFVENVNSRLRFIPIALEGRWVPFGHARSPYVSLGVELWHLSEVFAYRLGGTDLEAEGGRTTFGGVVGLGIELSEAPFPVRLGGRLEMSSIERRRFTSDGATFDTGDSRVSTFLSIGIEVEG